MDSKNYNINNIDEDELKVLVDSFELGKDEFFLSGKKYSLYYVNEVKIFEHSTPIDFDSYADSIDRNVNVGLVITDINSDECFTPTFLKRVAKDVTKKFMKEDFGSKKTLSINNINKDMDIFISHSSEDVEIAKALINLMKKAIKIDSSKIRCTSVDGFRLPIGASTEEHLRQEIFSSKVFVGLITRRSIKSTFVLFELGARWSTKEPLLPLICDNEGTSLLEGPLKNINALDATNPSALLQFIEELAKHLKLTAESASSYYDEVDILKNISNIKSSNETDSTKKIGTHKNQAGESDSIIKSQAEILWSDDYEMQIDHIKRQEAARQQLNTGKPDDLTDDEFYKIRERAKQSWPLDFEMQLDQEKKQIESLRKLKNM